VYAILIAATMSEIAIPAVPVPRYGEVPFIDELNGDAVRN
jgi:hypothetical protein